VDIPVGKAQKPRFDGLCARFGDAQSKIVTSHQPVDFYRYYYVESMTKRRSMLILQGF
jgi:hypothetical protein